MHDSDDEVVWNVLPFTNLTTNHNLRSATVLFKQTQL